MNRLRSAVVGTGFIGPVHVEAIRRLGHEVVGILGSTPEKSRAAAEALHLDKGYTSLDELLADDAVQVVHLTSPNRHHFAQCQAVLAAGKHLICEKPLAMNSQQTAELVRLAEQAPVVTAVNYNVRYYPLCLEVRQRLQSGAYGRIYHVSGSYLQDWLLYDTDFNWRVLASEGGELRAVADIGTHWLDLIGFITGLEVEELCADLRTVHPIRKPIQGSVETFTTLTEAGPRQSIAIDTEDYGAVLLRFRGGASGVLTVSQVTAGRKNCIRFDIAAERSAWAWDSEEPNTLHVGYRDRPNERLTRDPALLDASIRPLANYPGGHAEGFPDTFKQLFRLVYEAIEAKHQGRANRLSIPYPTFADGHREVVLCEAILRSHRERCWVRV